MLLTERRPAAGLLGSVGDAARLYERVGKPLLDRALGLVLLLVSLPVMLLVSMAVLVSLGWPVVYRQERIGLRGQRFTIYKFRSMHADRRVADQPVRVERRRAHKHPADPRLTATGRVLRAFSLDELPQLVNVLRGEMSLVGPRPELPEVVERHYDDLAHHRHQVKPGLTGLWQVTARGDDQPMHERVDLDLAYVHGLSPALDLAIMARTLPAALGRRRGH